MPQLETISTGPRSTRKVDLAAVIAKQERLKHEEEIAERDYYAIRLLPDAREAISEDFLVC